MTREEVIKGLQFTIEMFLFDPSTGETLTEPRNNLDKATIDACKGAIELLKQQPCEEYNYKALWGQVKWERDVAIEQLEQLGYSLGEKIRTSEDCISRQYLIEKATSWDAHFADSERAVSLTDIMSLPTVTPQQTSWIPVSERLPEKDEVVLITNKWHEVDKALYIGNEMFDIIINYLKKEEVIAWQPLPQPYKAESEDKE